MLARRLEIMASTVDEMATTGDLVGYVVVGRVRYPGFVLAAGGDYLPSSLNSAVVEATHALWPKTMCNWEFLAWLTSSNDALDGATPATSTIEQMRCAIAAELAG